MDVILLQKIRNLGNLGDQVKVRAGYARNFLIPYGKAIIATEESKAQFESRRAELEAAQADALNQARARADKLQSVRVELPTRASDEGKLFGSVGPREIAEALSATGTEVNRAEVLMPEGPIKELGEHSVELALHAEVIATVTVAVLPEA